MKYFQALILCFLLSSCARKVIETREDAMRPSTAPEKLEDDLGYSNLAPELAEHIRYAKSKWAPDELLVFGSRVIPASKYILALEDLQKVLSSNTEDEIRAYIRDHFEFEEVYGIDSWGEIFMTSYYQPSYPGSLKKTKEFSQAIYYKPKDLVQVDLTAFVTKIPALLESFTYLKDAIPKGPKTLTARYDEKTKTVVPYYSREEIDNGAALAKDKLEIVWLKPEDAFFLQIQGSGTVVLPGAKKITVGYSAQNGYPYVPIGKFLTDRIPIEEMSLQRILSELHKLSPAEKQKILNQNPSYVFFQKLEKKPLTAFGNEVFDGRTAAVDARFFPRGTLAFLQFDKPVFDSKESTKPSSWLPVSRFVIAHDAGGAIKGPGRLDLFWGKDEAAAQSAGVLRHKAKLYFLVPKAQ